MRVDWECLSTTAVASIATASMPMHRAVPRATFGSRLSSRRGAAASSAHGKSQAPLRRQGIAAIQKLFAGPFYPMKADICQYGSRRRQTGSMVWRMGLSIWLHPADGPCSAAAPTMWPIRELCPLMATFLMLARSRGAIGRSRATPGALPTAGRRSDGPDGRVDGIPGQGKGLSIGPNSE